jgi:hypothetical protein
LIETLVYGTHKNKYIDYILVLIVF